MEVITIESQAFSRLLSNLENLTREIHSQNQNKNPQTNQSHPKEKLALGDLWFDNEEACKILKVTKRTLQNYRDNFILPYSQIGRKVYYKASDVQTLLEKNYITLNPP
ncbi:MAG: helix-turn-helix domain-containing protein [Prolixibacteraceae bacterium]